MSEEAALFIPTGKLADWKKELTQLELDIQAKLRRKALLTERLQAVAILTDETDEESEEKPALQAETLFDNARPVGADNTSMIDAVEKMANAASRPVPKADVRKKLSEMGFPEGSLGNYFYTVIARLKGKDRITVTSNGDIWRAPPRN